MSEMPDIRLIEPQTGWGDELAAYMDEMISTGRTWMADAVKLVRCDYTAYLRRIRDESPGQDLPPMRAPQRHYWLVRGGRILGTARLRHPLNDELRQEGGNIGYDVRPSERGKGYATRLLRLLLDQARSEGLRSVLLTCNKENLASRRVIEKNRGVLVGEGVSDETGKEILRYRIEL
jgi:predicted acetyltransferase